MIVSSENVVAHLRQLRGETDLRREGVAVYHYFDTADIRQAIAGVHAYLECGDVTANAPFAIHHAIVWALFSAGNLGPIRLLPPHQAELLALLQYNFYIEDDSQHQRYATDFLRHVHGVIEHTHAPDERLVVRFKAQEALWSPWRTRLATFVEAKLLDVETVRHDYASIVQTDTFHRLYDAFTDHRPAKSMNNFADAAALTTLLRAAELFRKGGATELPFFYASSTLFSDVLRQTGYRDQLVVSYHDIEIDLLTPGEYFIIRALFRGEVVTALSAELEDGATQLEKVFAETPTATDLRVLALNGNFETSIDDVVQHLFNQRVWVPSAKRLNIQHDEFPVLRLEHEERRHWAEDRVRDVTLQLRRNTEEFRRLRDVWLAVAKALDEFAARLRKAPVAGDPLNTDGLLRFSFPPATLPTIKNLLLALQSEDEAEFDRVAILVYHVLREPDSRRPEYVAVAAILWVLRLDERLLTLLGDLHLPHRSLEMLRIATLLRKGAPLNVIEQFAAELERKWDATTDSRERAELAIGIAYIEYRLAARHGFTAAWRPPAPDLIESHPSAAKHIRVAIERARAALAYTGFDPGRQAYAANIYLFYLVEEGSADDGGLRQAASRLVTFRSDPQVWWYRFDDTLARYFFLRYQRESAFDSRSRLLQWALDAITVAQSAAPDDHIVGEFYSHVQLEYDALRSGVQRTL